MSRARLTLHYAIEDAYGVREAGGAVALTTPPTAAHSLFGPPTLALSLPGGANGVGEARTTLDLSEHPWAGARVNLTLIGEKRLRRLCDKSADRPRAAAAPLRQSARQVARRTAARPRARSRPQRPARRPRRSRRCSSAPTCSRPARASISISKARRGCSRRRAATTTCAASRRCCGRWRCRSRTATPARR